ncbi:MAG: DinB family protein [Armatimonadetes bacterium]|nr:DinB family protein [Armatimonadota bacterium]
MQWRPLLEQSLQYTVAVTDNLMSLTEDSALDWKPSSGENWLTTGQLLDHLATCCEGPFKGFITGEWAMPEDCDPNEMSMEDMLPPAEKFPTVDSVASAREKLAADLQGALAMLAKATDEQLENQPSPAMWDPTPMPLGKRLLTMVDHLAIHKAQLFYYLKLQGKPVNTMHLWAPG